MSLEITPAQAKRRKGRLEALRVAREKLQQRIGGSEAKNPYPGRPFEAWGGGPTRRNKFGEPGKYNCQKCGKNAPGVYQTQRGWVCAECKGEK